MSVDVIVTGTVLIIHGESLCLCLSVFVSVSVCLSVCLPVCLSVCLPVCLAVSPENSDLHLSYFAFFVCFRQ